jgi:peptidoglycan-N-acetylglucosamine deacetylase
MIYRKVNIIWTVALLILIIVDWQLTISPFFYLIIILSYVLLSSWGTLFIASNFFINTKSKASIASSSVAITFDDGPVADNTERVLTILKEHNAKATFFCIGKNVQALPLLAKQIHIEGHIIANHSFYHGALFDLQSTKKMSDELVKTNQSIANATGFTPRFFRPPYGITNPLLANAVKGMDFVAVGWSVRSFDTIAKSKEKLFNRITKNLKAGDIILLHDRCDITIEILPQLLTHIKTLGLQVESLDKLIQEKAYE